MERTPSSAPPSARAELSWHLVVAGILVLLAALAITGWVQVKPAAARSWDRAATGSFHARDFDLHPVDPWPLVPGSELPADSPVPLFEYEGQRWDHPSRQMAAVLILIAQYDIDHDAAYLEAAERISRYMLDYAVPYEDALFFPYPFDWGTSKAPWYSGLAQGKALSGFSRLYERTGDAEWRDAADATFASFLVAPGDHPWVSFVDESDNLWLEEYPGDDEPTQVFNGHVVGIYGLYDYVRVTGSADATRILNGALTTVTERGAEFRCIADISWYGLRHGAKHPQYHKGHIIMMKVIFQMTEAPEIQRLTDGLRWDSTWRSRRGSTAVGVASVGFALLGSGMLTRSWSRLRPSAKERRGRGIGPNLVEPVLVGLAAAALSALLGTVLHGFGSPLGMATVGIVAGLAWRDRHLIRRWPWVAALLLAVLLLVLAKFMVSPSHLFGTL